MGKTIFECTTVGWIIIGCIQDLARPSSASSRSIKKGSTSHRAPASDLQVLAILIQLGSPTQTNCETERDLHVRF